MDLLKGVIGGLIGGLVGAGIWAAVAYSTSYESGWIAWGIGFLSGLGVTIGMGGRGGAAGGGVAVMIALASIAGGKYATVELIANQVFSKADKQMDAMVTDDLIFRGLVHRAAAELEKDGKTVRLNNGKTLETTEKIEDYPDWLVKDRRAYFDALSADDREAMRRDLVDRFKESRGGERASAKADAFAAGFSPFDALWGLFAVLSAWRVGSSSR
jgi:hypothetical protein